MDKKVSRDDRTTALGLWTQAKSFASAADFLIDNGWEGPFDHPTYYLLGHAIELALKSFLRAKGKTPHDLWLLRHDLDAALELANSLGLPASPVQRAAIHGLNLYYKAKEFEYIVTGYKELPTLEILQECADALISDVSAVARQ
ncbi:MAG: hypothetical protein WD014_05820 [Dongiaceae bacterium]